MREKIEKIAQKAAIAAKKLAVVSTERKDEALREMAKNLLDKTGYLIEENQKDLTNAREKGLSSAMIDRLRVDEKGVRKMVDGIKVIIELPDPVGRIENMRRLPNGLQIGKIRIPIGVIGIIYESRPNVTVDTATLCLKSGNAVILRGGSESINSNIALARVLNEALESSGFPKDAAQLIDVTDRAAVNEMLKMDEYIDLIIPRGGHELIRMVVEKSSIPVIKHDKGLCHVYVDDQADLAMAENIAFNAKTQRPSVCNATETLLVHKDIAGKFLPGMINRLINAGVEVRGCDATRGICPEINRATEEDWNTEYLDKILSVKVVSGIDEAIEHISKYGSNLSDAIVTNSYEASWKFVREVDSASVFVNASTRFTDGAEFGLGAEMGISTQKLHCRGPMGLEELTTYKYIGFGNGQIKE